MMSCAPPSTFVEVLLKLGGMFGEAAEEEFTDVTLSTSSVNKNYCETATPHERERRFRKGGARRAPTGAPL
jgi:hypothetical protein